LKELGATYVIKEEELRDPALWDRLANVPKPVLGLNCVSGKAATDMSRLLE
jgi:hypothetical protein